MIWIVGSSIVRDAFNHVHNTAFHVSGVNFFWDFQPGMRISHLLNRINWMLSRHLAQSYLLVHCGGNGIGQPPLNETELLGINTLQKIQSVINCKIIGSQILPRLVYRNEISHVKLNKSRRPLNTTRANFCI